MEENTNNNNNNNDKAKSGVGAINDNTDFWKDAREFYQSQIPAAFQDKMLEYAKNKGYNQNEFRLFGNMLEAAISLEANIVLMKHYFK